jgi:hypothetical protein
MQYYERNLYILIDTICQDKVHFPFFVEFDSNLFLIILVSAYF